MMDLALTALEMARTPIFGTPAGVFVLLGTFGLSMFSAALMGRNLR